MTARELAREAHGGADAFHDEKAAAGYPHPFGSAAEMLEMGPRHGQIHRRDEMGQRDGGRVAVGGFATASTPSGRRWTTASSAGCAWKGELPGGLRVKRRAKAIHEQLIAERGSNLAQPHTVNDWLSVYAMAVNEENGRGGAVSVTSPTNGAAGVVPSVLRYYRDHCIGATEEGRRIFLLTASAIGGLIKHNASISGAEVGCQGRGRLGLRPWPPRASAPRWAGPTRRSRTPPRSRWSITLGMTCDPAGGLVQVPCIERNGLGAIKAVSAASLALRGDGTHFMPLGQLHRGDAPDRARHVDEVQGDQPGRSGREPAGVLTIVAA